MRKIILCSLFAVSLLFSSQAIGAIKNIGNFLEILPDFSTDLLSQRINIEGCCNSQGSSAYCAEFSVQQSGINVTAPHIPCQKAGIKLPMGYFPTNCSVQGSWCTFSIKPGDTTKNMIIYQNVIVRSISGLQTQNLRYTKQADATGWPGYLSPSQWGFNGAGFLNFNRSNNFVQAQAVIANPENGCVALNPETITGKIALIRRGTCQFGTKILNAQNAGAIAVIIMNNVDGLIPMGAGVDGLSTTLPAAMILKQDADALVNLINQGQIVSITLGNVS